VRGPRAVTPTCCTSAAAAFSIGFGDSGLTFDLACGRTVSSDSRCHPERAGGGRVRALTAAKIGHTPSGARRAADTHRAVAPATRHECARLRWSSLSVPNRSRRDDAHKEDRWC